MADLDQEKLIAYVEKMPAFPKSVQQVVHLSSDINASAKDIVHVIECDPVMTVKILTAINSAFYGLPNKITSVQRAVVHIGLNTIKNLALAVAAMGMLNRQNKAHFNTDDFLLHALTTAAISRMLAERLGLSASECSDCFVAGLLHDFGQVVFAEFMPQEFRSALEKSKALQLPLQQTELEFMGLDHAQVGKILAEKWALSEQLCDAIAHHHSLVASANPLRDCIFAANQISNHHHSGTSGNPAVEPFPDFIVARFGLPLVPLMDELGDLNAVEDDAHAFISI